MFSSIAYAQSGTHEKIDLTDYSLEELVDLHNDVRAELADRLHLNEDSIIGRSCYTVGRDIKAGHYTFTVAETEESSSGNPNNYFEIYDPETQDILYNCLNTPVGATIVVSLTDGQEVEFSRFTCYVSVSNPVWAP